MRLIIFQPYKRKSLDFATIATMQSFQWVPIHHKLVVIPQGNVPLSVATREEGVTKLYTLQQFLVDVVPGSLQLSAGDQSCEK